MNPANLDELYKGNDNTEQYTMYKNVPKKTPVAKKEINLDDQKEFEKMQEYIASSDNRLVSSAYSEIIKTFSKDKITKKDTKDCLEKMRNALPNSNKQQYTQMLYWASRCCEYSHKENEAKSKKATNNYSTYKRFELFVKVRQNSDNENFYHLNRCISDIDKLNISTRLKTNFIEESQKICQNENFIKNCQNQNKKIKQNDENEIINFNNSQIRKREYLSNLR